MVSCSSEQGIVMLLFEEDAHDFIGKLLLNENNHLIDSKDDFLQKLEFQLEEYFAGERKSFQLQLDQKGSDFQQNVWKIIQDIPFGETRNYGDIASEMGGLNFTRAVAKANAQNNILLLIPCHRVIGNGNKLTGYRGGVERKKWLIGFERSFLERKDLGTLF